MSENWKTIGIVTSALFFGVLGILVWKRKRYSLVKVGKISKLLFYPVKSMKVVEVQEGYCTNFGFEVNGLLDRSFMLVDADGKLISQREECTLAHFTPFVKEKTLSISAPSGEVLNVAIKDCIQPDDKIVHCFIHNDSAEGVDCGIEAARFFQKHLKTPGIRLVRQFSSLPARKYLKNNPFHKKNRENNTVGFQDYAAFHIVSEASIDVVNSKLENKTVSFLNFRPNILISDCEAFAEDSWEYMKFNSKAEFYQLRLTSRCILTTNDPKTAIITKKEPLVSMRKFRIPKDPEMLRRTDSLPCLGISLACLKNGAISIGEDLFAVVGKLPEMMLK